MLSVRGEVDWWQKTAAIHTADVSHRARWTTDDDRRLVWYWGHRRPKAVAKLLGRTVAACNHRMRVLTGSASTSRGTYTIRRLSLETGYGRDDIKRAIDALGLLVQLRPRTGARINDAQKSKILDWLGSEPGGLTGQTLIEVASDLGVSVGTVARWAKLLGIDVCKGKAWGQLTPSEVEQIRNEVVRVRRVLVTGDRWSHHHECCVQCGTTDTKHKGRGMCRTCYTRQWKLDK